VPAYEKIKKNRKNKKTHRQAPPSTLHVDVLPPPDPGAVAAPLQIQAPVATTRPIRLTSEPPPPDPSHGHHRDPRLPRKSDCRRHCRERAHRRWARVAHVALRWWGASSPRCHQGMSDPHCWGTCGPPSLGHERPCCLEPSSSS
jgi:hypothetical protein